MLSKHIREKIQAKYGHSIRYPKDCHALAEEISAACKAKISASTLKRLYGFVKGASQEPRLYTLDLISEYLGYKGWEHLLSELAPEVTQEVSKIQRLTAEKIKKDQIISLSYEPTRVIELQKKENGFLILSSNDRKVLVSDIVYFKQLELHYPVIFESVYRKGVGLGKIQIAAVSGLTAIKED